MRHYERRLDETAELERAREDTATLMQRTRKLEDLLTGKEAEISEATRRAVATEESDSACSKSGGSDSACSRCGGVLQEWRSQTRRAPGVEA